MKYIYRHITPLIIALGFVACTDEIDAPDAGADAQEVYILQLSIDNSELSRAGNIDMPGGMKTTWFYGDKVTLESEDGAHKYVFTLEPDAEHAAGTAVPAGKTVNFTYDGAIIENRKNFTGRIYYEPEVSRESIIDEYSWTSIGNPLARGYYNTIPLDHYNYAEQASNDNTDHLTCMDRLEVKLKNISLLSKREHKLKRGYSILKIILDDIHYPIYGGSILCVNGLHTQGADLNENTNRSMLLGDCILKNKEGGHDSYYFSGDIYADTKTLQDPLTDLGQAPFYDVPSGKQPFTGYATRDESHKLVAYMYIDRDLEVVDGQKISVGLRDSWSFDWYIWETTPLHGFKLPLGNIYTIDFTEKAGGDYRYNSYAIINLSPAAPHEPQDCGFYYVAERNLGAQKPTDQGWFYMIGHDKHIVTGGHYPNYPQKTPYYFYKEKPDEPYDGRTDFMSYSSTNWLGVAAELDFPFAENYRSNKIVNTINLNSSVAKGMSPCEWWDSWLKDEFCKLPDFIGGEWHLAGNVSDNNIGKNQHLKELIGRDGNPTSDPSYAAGVRISSPRTGHGVYIPITGVLYPSSQTLATHQIDADATADVEEASKTYAMIASRELFYNHIDNGKDVKMLAFAFDSANEGKAVRLLYSLDYAVPIRPIFFDNIESVATEDGETGLKFRLQVLSSIPGWNNRPWYSLP